MTPISRRAVLGGTLGLIGATATGARASQAPGERPNILCLVSEDNNPYIGAYGDRLARTPNIDALAARGVLFRNAYSVAPVCAPSRFGLLTGIDPRSCSPAQHMRAEARLPEGFKTYPELLRQAGYFAINNPKTDYNCNVDPRVIWDVQGVEGHWRLASPGQPFVCVLNTGTTHENSMCSDRPGSVSPQDVRVPAFLPDTPTVRADIARYYNAMEAMDQEIGNWLGQLQADGLADDTIVIYYGDNGGVLPRSKRYCYEEGLRVPLVVYVPPKWQHLAPSMPGSVVEAPVTLLDVPPSLLSVAGVDQPPQMSGKPLLGRQVGQPATYAFGFRDRMDERIDLVRTVTDGRWRYIRNYMPHRPNGQHVAFEWSMQASYREWNALHLAGQLTPQQDAFFQPKPFEELYDLAADPDEVHNLIGSPAAAATAMRLARALDRHMLAINDNGFLPEGAEGEGYFESRNRAVYPLRSLMTLAARAARRRPRNLARFQRLLASPVAATRFWAARGLLLLGPGAAPAREALRGVLANDSVPQVRVVAAEALVALGEQDRAVAALVELGDEPNSLPVRVQAFNALTYLGEAARPALPLLRKVAGMTVQPGQTDYMPRLAAYLIAVLEGTYDPRAEAIPAQGCAAINRSGALFMGPAPSAALHR